MIIKSAEFAKRRKILMKKMAPCSLAILPAAFEVARSADVYYPFRQQNNFYYLTGFPEPKAIAILAPKRKKGEYILFSQENDPEHEIWEGKRAGQTGACEIYGAEQAFPINDFQTLLPLLLADIETIYYSLGLQTELDQQIINTLNSLRVKARNGLLPPINFIDIAPLIHEMRLFKSKTEISLIQKAVDISIEAHINAMTLCQPGIYEYELEAELTATCLQNGARFQAYPPIIGSGKNTCVLHYHDNNQIINKNDLVLIDAGAEYQNYAADITRTFPARGHFSAEQHEIYNLVLNAQLAAIHNIKPGADWQDAQEIIVRYLTQGLIDLGILKGDLSNLIERAAYQPFYMHKSGHWLGLDVHDVGTYKIKQKWRKLESNMVLTVEPGLYLSSSIKGLAKRWHNIGVRIEDDILVTETGHQVLSQALPKKIHEIEAIMRA